jgi:hypothetical protein
MADDRKEQAMLRRDAISASGRILRHEFEAKQQEIPEHIPKVLDQLEVAGKPETETKTD